VRRFLDAGVDSFAIEVGTSGDKLEGAIRDMRRLRAWMERVLQNDHV
jgi:hypothetical protein